MSKPLVVSIPHKLGKDEALRRIKSGIGRVQQRFAAYGSLDEETWTDDHLDFRISALKQSLRGGLDVGEQNVTVSIELPWVLSMLAEKAKALITKHGGKMLQLK